MIANSSKTKCLLFAGKPAVLLNATELLENVKLHKYLGIFIASDLKWPSHVQIQLNKARKTFFSLRYRILFNTPSKTKLNLYTSMVLSILLYGNPVWHPDVTRMKEMENFQKSCLRWVFGSKLQYEQQLKSYDMLPVSGFSILYTISISISIFFSPISISIFLSKKFNINLKFL